MARAVEHATDAERAVTIDRAAAGEPDDRFEVVPTTEFGQRLLALHLRLVESGEALLTREDLEREIAERRGGIADGDVNER